MNNNYTNILPLIHQLEQKGLVTRTFRRLDPDRQQSVLNAILDEAAETGPSDMNVKHIAERCSVAVGSLYQYFGNRENLLAFTIELVVTTTVDLFNSYRPYLAEMPFRDALQAYIGGGLEWTREQLGFARFFAKAAYQGDPDLSRLVVEPIASALTGMMRDMLLAAQKRGELRENLDLEATARVLNTLVIAVSDAQLLPYLNSYYQLTDEGINVERSMKAVLSFVESGILLDTKA